MFGRCFLDYIGKGLTISAKSMKALQFFFICQYSILRDNVFFLSYFISILPLLNLKLTSVCYLAIDLPQYFGYVARHWFWIAGIFGPRSRSSWNGPMSTIVDSSTISNTSYDICLFCSFVVGLKSLWFISVELSYRNFDTSNCW